MAMPEVQNPYLYLLMRNDLHSMNPGKAVAHGAHAANKFTYDMNQGIAKYPDGKMPEDVMTMVDLYHEWERSANGFGTTITLSGSLRELEMAVALVQSTGGIASLSVDPSYPYMLHREYANLIQHPQDYPPVALNDGMMMCFRPEVTAAYVFGLKPVLQPLIGNLPLMK